MARRSRRGNVPFTQVLDERSLDSALLRGSCIRGPERPAEHDPEQVQGLDIGGLGRDGAAIDRLRLLQLSRLVQRAAGIEQAGRYGLSCSSGGIAGPMWGKSVCGTAESMERHSTRKWPL